MFPDPNVLVGYEKADDAGVYRLDDRTALVQTVDFFTPIVDDAYTYGQIAAANSLSDVYAMGGVPRFALSIVGFPKEKVEEEILHDILRGGADKMREARVTIMGGHSVQDEEIKFGYCVSGFADPTRIYTNSGARPGDLLILTKPIGTGIITTGVKFGKASEGVLRSAIDWMLQLNGAVSDHLKSLEIHAVTDITGYGLMGHAYEMAQGSEVTLHLSADQVPLMEGAQELAGQGMLSGGVGANRRYVGNSVAWDGIPRLKQEILLDPQTSGGLLISLPEAAADSLCRSLDDAGLMGRPIGRVAEKREFLLVVE